MATLRNMLMSVWRCKRSQFVVPRRHTSHGCQLSNSTIIQSSILHEINLKRFGITSSISLTNQSSPSTPLVEKTYFPILPTTPVERLTKFQLPTTYKNVSLEMPSTKASLDNTPLSEKIEEIKAPQRGNVLKIYAHRMLIIRHRKMKKHQLKKWRKKFRVQIMTRKKKRFVLRETLFFSGLEEEMKLAESFNAQQYAEEKIKKAYKPKPVKPKLVVPLPWEFQPLFYNSNNKKGNK